MSWSTNKQTGVFESEYLYDESFVSSMQIIPGFFAVEPTHFDSFP